MADQGHRSPALFGKHHKPGTYTPAWELHAITSRASTHTRLLNSVSTISGKVYPESIREQLCGYGLAAVGGYVPEGEMPRRSLRPYAIAYRSLLPRRDEATNLLVPVALSASHVGFSPIRMEPTWGMLGHAVGAAIVLCMGTQRMPFELPVGELQARLLSEGQIIDPSPFTEYWPKKWPPQE